MKKLLSPLTALLAVAMVCASPPLHATPLIVDNFEVDSSADYLIRDESNSPSGDGTPDSTSAFAFDYISAGLPLAPNSTAGDVGGLRLAANETGNDAGAADHITAFHNTVITASAYELTVDMYMGVDTGASGTTEMSTVGVGSDAADFNSIFTPIAGAGHYVSITGDGGSASDFRHYTPSVTSVPSGDPSYLNSTNTTNASGDTYQAIFPGGDFPGSPGNRWTTLSIRVSPSLVTYALDGTPFIQTATESSSGQVSLGYTDLFSSVGPHFVVYDNLSVEVIPEPASLSALALTCIGAAALRRRRG